MAKFASFTRSSLPVYYNAREAYPEASTLQPVSEVVPTVVAVANGANGAASSPGSPEVVARVVITNEWQPSKRELKASLLAGGRAGSPGLGQLQQELARAQNSCTDMANVTPAQLVRVLRATTAITDLVTSDPKLDGSAEGKATRYIQLVIALMKHQAQLLSALADDWSMPHPRCSMPAHELLQHVEALAAWYVQIHDALQRQRRKNYITKLFSSTKDQERFKCFERVLSEHGDMINDLNKQRRTSTSGTEPAIGERHTPPARRTISDVVTNYSSIPDAASSSYTTSAPLANNLVVTHSAPPERRSVALPSNNPFAPSNLLALRNPFSTNNPPANSPFSPKNLFQRAWELPEAQQTTPQRPQQQASQQEAGASPIDLPLRMPPAVQPPAQHTTGSSQPDMIQW